MQLSYHKTLVEAPESSDPTQIFSVTAMCWSPNGKRLAVCTVDRVVLMFDENGTKRDKFPTKSIEKGFKEYFVKQMAFSPSSDKLAVAQTDNSVFVYKIGLEWGEKKSICNKFQHGTPTLCLVWPSQSPSEIIYGLYDGSVRVGNIKTHKTRELYMGPPWVYAMAVNPAGSAIVVSHMDGTVYMYSCEHPDRAPRIIIRNKFSAQALVWAKGVIAMAGHGTKIVFYDEDGAEEATFDNGAEHSDATFYEAACRNSTGEAIIFGTWDCLFVYGYNRENLQWEKSSINHVENMLSVTTLAWKQDGSMVSLGTLGGMVDMYDVALRGPMKSSGYEAIYVSHSQVLVRKEKDRSHQIVLNSQRGQDIRDISLFAGRYLTGHTDETVFIADLTKKLLSEVEWHSSQNRIDMGYNFDDESAVIIHDGSELFIVELGSNEILGSVRTCKISTDVVSLRLNQPRNKTSGVLQSGEKTKKLMSYLLDDQTICIKDFNTNSQVTFCHDYTVDWMELNPEGDLLLYRDLQQNLHICFLDTQLQKQLLTYCGYVQWVPDTDVIVAGSLDTMRVWYNVRGSEQSTSVVIKGDIIDIERNNGRTEVIVNEGLTEAVYSLDESLIEFTTCVLNKEFRRAMDILEDIEMSVECEDNWKYLGKEALKANEIAISQRCAVATGDVAADAFLGCIVDMQKRIKVNHGTDSDSLDHYAIHNKLALFNKDMQAAEDALLNQSRVDECIDMYLSLQKSEDAIRVAKMNNRLNRAEEIRDEYMQLLLDSGQNMQVGVLKEGTGEYIAAIEFYLKASAPNKASRVIEEQDIRQPAQLVESVASSLTRAGMHDRAGVLYERLNMLQKALESFVRGKDFKRAVDLARKKFPARVVELQEKWGDYLVLQKKIDMAINHYNEAKLSDKAIKIALHEKHFERAFQLVENISGGTGNVSNQCQQYYSELGDHYASNVDKLDIASKCYIAANQPQCAVTMYLRYGNFEIAEKLAKTHMNRATYESIYNEQAKILERAGDFVGAESLYISVNEYKLAIDMYTRNQRFKDMLRLTTHYCPDKLRESNLLAAKCQEDAGCLKDAENFYVDAAEASMAVQMYARASKWNDALRCARAHCDQEVAQNIAIDLFINVGVPGGVKVLDETCPSMFDLVVNRILEEKMFDLAYEIVQLKFPQRLTDVYVNHAWHLKDQGNFEAAEKRFIEANRAGDAIDMYLEIEDWSNSLRIAKEYFDTHSPHFLKVMIGQANSIVKSGGDLEKAEAMFIGASEPDLAIDMYLNSGNFEDAQRVAKFYLPQRLNEVIKLSTLSDYPSVETKKKVIIERTSNDVDKGSVKAIGCNHNQDVRIETKDNHDINTILESLSQAAEKSKWSTFWKIADVNMDVIPNELMRKYTLMNVDELIDQSGTALDDAVKLLRRYPVHNEAVVPVYRRLVKCLMMQSQESEGVDHRDVVASLRDLLYKSAKEMKTKEMDELLFATHYQHMFYLAESLGFKDIAAKCAVTLLKFPSVVPQDRAFYRAGMIAKELELTNVAFVLLNRYVDIAEAIDTGDDSRVDYQDFYETDAIPLNDAPIPTSHYVTDEREREACRSWVLSAITDPLIDQVIPSREDSRKTLFEGFYSTNKPNCIVTGFPVHPAEKLEVNNVVANRKDWNLIVSKTYTCPWSGLRNQRPLN